MFNNCMQCIYIFFPYHKKSETILEYLFSRNGLCLHETTDDLSMLCILRCTVDANRVRSF